MSRDIVNRLRLWADWLHDRCPDTAVMSDLRDAADEIERLRAERDEARRKICKIESEAICDPPRSPQKYAILMGWDCFKQNTDE
jgi:hypothetical protein